MSFFTRRRAAKVAARKPEPPPVVELPAGIGADGYPTAFTLFSTLGLTAGQGLVVASDQHVFYDLASSPSLGDIIVNGKFTFDDSKDQVLTCANFMTNSTGKTTGVADGGSNSLTFNRNRTKRLDIILTGAELSKANVYNIDDITTNPANALKKLSQGTVSPPTSADIETYTITRTSSTQFSVSSNLAGSLGTGTVGTLWNKGIRFLAEVDIGNNRTIRASRRGYSNSSLSRGFINDRGQVFLKGKVTTPFTFVQTTAATPRVAANSTVIPLETVPTDWAVGNEVAIAPSEFYFYAANQVDPNQLSQVERYTITALDGVAKTITISAGLKKARWGMKQWIQQGANDAQGRMTGNMSLTPTGYVHHVSGIADELDERAVVVNLTRSVTISSINDAAWQDANTPFGCHTMTMGKDAVWQLEYVSVIRGGQLGRVGRYPYHWHMCSYNMPDGMGFPSDGVYIGDVDPTKQYLKGCVAVDSAQHHFQLHGTCGALLDGVVGVKCNGHSLNFEDGSEMRNVIKNSVFMDSTPIPNNRDKQLKHHEAEAAGLWVTNLNNDIYDCHTVLHHHCTWMSPAARCFGLSRDVNLAPINVPPSLNFKRIWNSCSKGLYGMLNGGAVGDERGGILGNDGTTYGTNNLNNQTGGVSIKTAFYNPRNPDGTENRDALLKEFTVFKCPIAYFNQVSTPVYQQVIIADIAIAGLQGAVSDGYAKKCLFIGQSNNVTPYVGRSDFPFLRATDSYHNTQVNQDCLFVNWTYNNTPNRTSTNAATEGIWTAYAWDAKNGYPGQEVTGRHGNGTSDFYLQNPELGYMYHTNNKFLSTEPAYKSRPWNYRQLDTGEADKGANNNSLSQADLDAQGWWGPAGWYRIPNHTYYTYGSTTQAIFNDPYYVVTPDKQYGGKFVVLISANELKQHELTTQLLDSSYAPIAGATYTLKRNTDAASNGSQFRYVNFRKNDSLRYKITLGTTASPTTTTHFMIQNANAATDRVKVGIPFGKKPTTVGCRIGNSYGNNGITGDTYTEAASLAAMGDKQWYYDGTHVWVGYVGGYSRASVYVPSGANGEGPGTYRTLEQPQYPNTIIIVP